MKTALAIIFIALALSPCQAQDLSIERDFERQRPKLTLDRYDVGEDATSGYDYLVYKKGAQVIKIRAIWNGGCCNAPEISDYYFKNGNPALYVKLAGRKAQLRVLARGRKVPLKLVEKFYLNDSKLTKWIKNGKVVSPSDPGWHEQERDVLERFKNELEGYRMHQEGTL